jgi:hypothetical protein
VHIHLNQINPNTETNSLYAAQKAAAKGEVQRTRTKLLGFGYEVASDSESGEACLVELNCDEDSRPRRRQPGRGRATKKQKETPEGETVPKAISDWA